MRIHTTQQVIDKWQADVDAEMCRLIESGVPPMDAAGQARRNVTARRQRLAREAKSREQLMAELAKELPPARGPVDVEAFAAAVDAHARKPER